MRRVAGSWKLIDACLKQHAPAAFRALRPPATRTAVATLERTLGVKLPAAVVTSYRVHDGMRDTTETLNNFHRPLAVREIAFYWRLSLTYPWDAPGPKFGHAKRIKADLRWRAKWVPLMVTAGGDLMGLDFDPGPAGKRGQLFLWANYGSPSPYVIAGSFREWLDRLATELAAGRFRYTCEDGLQIDPRLG